MKHTAQGVPGGASVALATSQADCHDATASQMETEQLTAGSPMAEQAEPHVVSAAPQQAAVEAQLEADASRQQALAPQEDLPAPQLEAAAQQQEAAADFLANRPQAAVAKASAAADAADPACKELLTAVFEVLKRYHVWWKANAGKTAEPAQQGVHVDKAKADELLSRCACLSVWAVCRLTRYVFF